MNNIKPLRQARNMTQNELATALGISQAQLSRLENEKTGKLDYRTAVQLLIHLNCTAVALFGEDYNERTRPEHQSRIHTGTG
jgi:transcriptional regulator with XRE-family HTH domain